MKKLIPALSLCLIATPAFALENIIKTYQSTRGSGMGGLKLTTGFYEENFYGNPARVSANPKFKVTILDPMVETNTHLPGAISALTGSGDVVKNLGSTAGDSVHARVQTTMPAVYFGTGEKVKLNFGIGLLTSIQTDIDLRRSFQIDPAAIADVGPALNVGYRFLENDALAIGATVHLTYRVTSKSNFTLIDLLKGTSLSPTTSGAQGAMIDIDYGATYQLPIFEDTAFKYNVAFAMNNLLGGSYDNLSLKPISAIGGPPRAQPRTLGFGASVTRAEWGKFHHTTFGLEFQDIGNNPDGSLFRLVHLGAESHWGVIAGRVGINQGYLCAGFGFDLRFVDIDLSTYGEELSTNVGGLEDRRFALRLAFQIQ
jgi:hypothetical protein